MACVRKRRGKWVVDYRDSAGIRRWITRDTKWQAEDALAEKLRESRQSTRPVVDPDITVSAYSVRWLKLLEASLKPATVDSYDGALRTHLLPIFGPVKVRQLQKGRIKAFLAEKLSAGLSRKTVRIIHATLRGMLNAAVDDGVILANPAERIGRHLRLTTSQNDRQEEIKAL